MDGVPRLTVTGAADPAAFRVPGMRKFLTALAAAVVAVAGPVVAHAEPSGGGVSGNHPIGGERLGKGPQVVMDGDAAAPPQVKAAAWMIADLDTGAVLAAKAPHARLRPASTLKTLTALVLLPRLDPKAAVTGTDEDAGIEGSKVGVSPGLRYTVDLLFLGLFLNSGNDAVHALARTDAGGVPATVQRMNAKAAQLGALDTHVVDPTGLDSDGQLTSAYDLALISRAGLRRADFRRYCSTKLAYFPLKEGGRYQISNQNHLLWTYPGALGVKTGYTTLARNTFVGAAERDGRRLIVTMLNAPHGVTQDAGTLLDWAFANRTALEPVGTLISPGGKSGKPKTVASRPEKPRTVSSSPKRNLTVHGPDRFVGALPLWTLAAPPLGMVIAWWFRPRPKPRQARLSSGRHRR